MQERHQRHVGRPRALQHLEEHDVGERGRQRRPSPSTASHVAVPGIGSSHGWSNTAASTPSSRWRPSSGTSRCCSGGTRRRQPPPHQGRDCQWLKAAGEGSSRMPMPCPAARNRAHRRAGSPPRPGRQSHPRPAARCSRSSPTAAITATANSGVVALRIEASPLGNVGLPGHDQRERQHVVEQPHRRQNGAQLATPRRRCP